MLARMCRMAQLGPPLGQSVRRRFRLEAHHFLLNWVPTENKSRVPNLQSLQTIEAIRPLPVPSTSSNGARNLVD
jgi:hypothetical protein